MIGSFFKSIMKRIIVSLYEYENSGADGVRIAGYIKGFIKLGYEVVLVTSCKEQIELKDDHLSIVLYEKNEKNEKKIGVLRKIISSYRLVKTDISQYEEGDVIFSYSIPRMALLFGRKRKIYYELTEVPMHGGKEDFIRRSLANYTTKIIKRASGLIVISKALKEYYIEQGISAEKICVSNMTVDLTRFENVKKESVEQRYIAYCGSINNHKDGVDTLIRAFAIVANKHQNIKLYLIGKFPVPEEKEQDIAIAESLNVLDKVVFCGLVSSKDLPQMLKNAECLVLARPDNKQAKYGFPTKLGEYLLTENPVVVTRVGDIPFFLENGISAFLANPDDIEDIAAKIEEALSSPNSKIIGEKGAEVARLCFNSDIEAKKVGTFMFNRNPLIA